MIILRQFEPLSPLREAINAAYLMDETTCVRRCVGALALDQSLRNKIFDQAHELVTILREDPASLQGLDAFLQEYDLSNEEGVVLMCLAEALLRIPDASTADRLIREKLSKGKWDRHLGHSQSALVNASTWGLMLTGRLVQIAPTTRQDIGAAIKALIARGGEPLIRLALRQAMEIIGHQFVLGETITEALERSGDSANAGYMFSYDMLGEAALTAADAQHFFEDYIHAIEAVGTVNREQSAALSHGVSLKLSAMHPRYEFAQRGRVLDELSPRLLELARLAKEFNLLVTVDAEEAAHLDLSLDIFERVIRDNSLSDWDGFGIAVQSYQKRALGVIDWLADLAQRIQRRIPVRMTKGAYWDTEIKRAQQVGLASYPVFTRKHYTDVSFLACMAHIRNAGTRLYPQFATHNAYSICAAKELFAGREFEYQRLHGMGQALYDRVLEAGPGLRCRVYAPVGGHAQLLPYLVRRLLENGANTSFVNRIVHREVPVEQVVADPVIRTEQTDYAPHPEIRIPPELFKEQRVNSRGVNLTDAQALASLAGQMAGALQDEWTAAPVIAGTAHLASPTPVYSPADTRRQVGTVSWADHRLAVHAVEAAAQGFGAWMQVPANERAQLLDQSADLLEAELATLMALCVQEAGKTIPDSVAEVREAVDFCRYYAHLARTQFQDPQTLTGPSGELNQLTLHGRGAFVCISPWNFPLAIFLGQVAAALAAGNTVLAKPAEQTPLIAGYAVQLLHQAGIPQQVLHFLPGDGKVGAALVENPQIAGVAFTGSTETAKQIQQALADRPGPILPLIAETGGQNAMIADSSALGEQVIMDVIQSAFNSAGQRCSACRVLFIQQDVAPRFIEMLQGAMAELTVGDPALLSTDIGPVIDTDARNTLDGHDAYLDQHGKLIYRCILPVQTRHGTYFAPRAYEIESLDLLEREIFGPILHVIRFHADEIDSVIESVNATGYGLTLGIHSRIDETIDHIIRRARVGNIYVNRNMIGAVVGVQPFGGEGLSGTGPKAGGPNYLKRFAVERTVSNNIAAVGGNADLLSLAEQNL